MSDLPEPDRVDGAPHPRETTALFGHARAEADILRAIADKRVHHAWLITGPRGVGKATLAWRFARYLIATPPQEDGPSLFGDPPPPPDTLDIAPDHPAARRVAALSDPGLMLIRRGASDDGKRLKSQITVDEVRKLNAFFGLSASDGGMRVVIVDSADEMNVSAANALLKLLEEPPKRTVLLLIAHQPSRLLPTIRSRCRELRLSALGPDDLAKALAAAGAEVPDAAALAEISGGSVGRALTLLNEDGVALYGEIIDLLSDLPRLDRQKALKLAERVSARGATARLDLTLDLIDLALSRAARTGSGLPPNVEAVPGEAEVLAKLAPTPARARALAELQQSARARMDHGRAVNVDPQSLLLDLFLAANAVAASA